MINIPDFYILGLPIDTEIGRVEFIRIADYPQYFGDLQIMAMGELEIKHKYNEMNKDGSLDDLLREIKDLSLFELSISLPELRQAYSNVYLKVFENERTVGLINQDNFNECRQLILRMNAIKEEEVNPNPEIQRAIERSRRVKSQGQERMSFSDMCSSIVAFTGKSYEDILKMTIYQFFVTFQRIGYFKSYDTSTLFATVSEKADITNWSKHIDLFEEEKHFVEENKFKSTTGKMFDGE